MAKQQRRGSGYRRAAENTTKYYLLWTRSKILIVLDVQEKTKSEEGTSTIMTQSKVFGKLLGAELAGTNVFWSSEDKRQGSTVCGRRYACKSGSTSKIPSSHCDGFWQASISEASTLLNSSTLLAALTLGPGRLWYWSTVQSHLLVCNNRLVCRDPKVYSLVAFADQLPLIEPTETTFTFARSLTLLRTMFNETSLSAGATQPCLNLPGSRFG